MYPLAEFASSPAGYLTGIATPVLTVIVGAMVTAMIRNGRDTRTALNEGARALAVLVANATNDREDIKDVRGDVRELRATDKELAASIAALRTEVERHHARARSPSP